MDIMTLESPHPHLRLVSYKHQYRKAKAPTYEVGAPQGHAGNPYGSEMYATCVKVIAF